MSLFEAAILIAAFFWMAAAALAIHNMRSIIERYERLLTAHDIPHSRRKNGSLGFYGHAEAEKDQGGNG